MKLIARLYLAFRFDLCVAFSECLSSEARVPNAFYMGINIELSKNIELKKMLAMNLKIQIQKLYDDAQLPKLHTPGSAGYDLYSYCPEKIIIEPLERKFIPTGIRIALPEGFDAEIRPRSGLANNFFLIIPNSPGTVDSDFRGEILVGLMNLGKEPFTVEHRMRIAQLVIRKTYHLDLEEVTELSATTRGEGGFGSTGFF